MEYIYLFYFTSFFAAVIKVAFESPSYTATESRPVEVCVNATDSRIKSQQRLNVTIIIAPATMGMSTFHIATPL